MNNLKNYNLSQSLEPYSIIRFVVKKLLLILLLSIIAGESAWLLSSVTYNPKYKVDMTFIVTTKGKVASTSNNISTTSKMASVFSEIVASKNLAELVAADLGTPVMEGSVESSVIPETNLLTMKVTSSDPEMAFRIAKSVMANYSKISSFVYDSAVIEPFAQPKVPTAPINASRADDLANKAAIFTFLILCALAAYISYLQDTVKNESQADEKLEINRLTSVVDEKKLRSGKIGRIFRLIFPDHKKNKKNTTLIDSVDCSFYYTEAFKSLRSLVEHHKEEWRKKEDHKGAYVVMVTSVAEGEGKSTVAANLALALARRHEDVLLIDGDLRRPVQYKYLLEGESKDATFYELLRNKKLDWLNHTVYQEKRNLHVLADAQSHEDSTELFRGSHMAKLMWLLREQMRYIIIDCPPVSQVADAEILADFADEIILTVREDYVSAADINDAAYILDQNKGKVSGFVFNLLNPRFLSNRMSYGYYSRSYGYGSYAYGYSRKSSYGYGSKKGYGYGYGASKGYGYGARKSKKKGQKDVNETENPSWLTEEKDEESKAFGHNNGRKEEQHGTGQS